MTPLAAHAAIRFGLGARPGAALPSDPRPWLEAQIRPLREAPGPSLAEGHAALRERRRDPKSQAIAVIVGAETTAWAERMLATEAPFAERWANFWANHFSISRRTGRTATVIGNWHRTAVRAQAFGRLEDMFLAVYRHPAMLNYLDQAGSVGANSPAGLRRQRGSNENLARECLELHSVTPEAGYSQEDVGALAQLLTGWSVGRGAEAQEPDGFLFRRAAHEPGPKSLLGQDFPEGEEGGVQALRYLAQHPSTRRALARKLARHFIADDPPAAAVARLEAALSGGDLSEAARAVIAVPDAWLPLRKLRDGQDYAIAVLRALGAGGEFARPLLATMSRFNQALWNAPAPIGWPDDAAQWAEPEQLMRRLDWAGDLAGRLASRNGIEPGLLAEVMLGPLARAETAQAVRGAGSAREAVLILLASPEAQRR